MKNIKGSKTEQNLIKAFEGESIARNKYTYFASQAKKDGYVQISKIFEETANNEKEHAKIWFKLIDKIGSTEENLKISIASEEFEAEEMYPNFAQEAEDEGFEEIAKLFRELSKVEANHENRYKKLLKNIHENKVFNSDTNTEWICLNCGHTHHGKTAPEECPVCSHKKEYFARNSKNC